ncbi:MAG: hypothetical protein KAR06_02865 [Deltaproteobacteria bacterium]|nr:hypothetical protein [Deltaproteobacteria bacterium]
MTVQIGIQLEEETCITCGIVFAIPEGFRRALKTSHKPFFCPSGHEMYYPGKTEAEKLRKELTEEQKRADELRAENYRLGRQRDGALETITRMKKRANAGVCPHCRRHFVNVEKHIHTKHKDKL